jgi:hypothetical protein
MAYLPDQVIQQNVSTRVMDNPRVGADRRPQMMEEMDNLEQEIRALEDVLTKLAPLLPPQPPEATNGTNGPVAPSLAPLPEQIRAYRHRIRRSVQFVTLLEI